ncbi:HAD-IIB family hydrolase [Spiroplasma endosymbiont of Crioceris asparagi]|uniref:HAD-IIB family hydrolase n=1 Tax=Spiroplasma endosymbiont of Crioceris asparagi TaxID=3066286 RepID=UPI0030D2225B
MNKNKKINLVFSDLDGTALNEKFEFSPETKDVIKKLFAQGDVFIPITGRNITNTVSLIKTLNNHEEIKFIIGHNGAQILDFSKKEFYKNNVIDRETIKKIFKSTYGRVGEVKIHFIGDKTTFSYGKSDDTEFWTKVMNKKYKIISDAQEIHEDINILMIILNENANEEDAKYMYELFSNHNGYKVHQYTNRVFEMSHCNSTKGAAALEVIGEYEKAGFEVESWCFGDGMNDVTMFKVIDNPVAMANANDNLKVFAKFITTTNKENGIAKFIEENILN